jgi:chromate reductase
LPRLWSRTGLNPEVTIAEAEKIQTLHVLGFAGRLRQGSYNRALLRAAQELASEGMVIDIFDFTPVPLYKADVEAQGDPEAVAAFKAAIRRADALLIACAEYNHGVPAC